MSFSYRWQRCNSGGVKCSNLKQGETVTGTSGTWSGAGPITFSYEWRRCDATGGDCRDTSSGQTRQLGTEDVGHTIRVEVRARNPYGSTTATSAPTAVVPPKGPVPASTAPPVITGLAREGQTLTASVGSWANGPTSFLHLAALRRERQQVRRLRDRAGGAPDRHGRRPSDPPRRRGHEPVRDVEGHLRADRPSWSRPS
jgi:hypothetical protein